MQEARSEYETAIRTATRFPEAHFALANLLVKTGAPAEAMQHYQRQSKHVRSTRRRMATWRICMPIRAGWTRRAIN